MKHQLELVQRVEYIKEVCCGKNVLHLGCTNYPYTDVSLENNDLLHLELMKITASLTGFDFDQRGLNVLAKRGVDKLYAADLENLENLDLNETFDVIVAGEIIEHLSNPGLFLRGIKRFMNPQTTLLVSTVNAYCAMRFAQYGLRGKGGLSEPVHPDHVAYYSYTTLSLVLKRENFKMKKFSFYDLGAEHRPFVRFYYKWFNDLCVRFAPHLADGVIIECQTGNAGE